VATRFYASSPGYYSPRKSRQGNKSRAYYCVPEGKGRCFATEHGQGPARSFEHGENTFYQRTPSIREHIKASSSMQSTPSGCAARGTRPALPYPCGLSCHKTFYQRTHSIREHILSKNTFIPVRTVMPQNKGLGFRVWGLGFGV